MCSHSVAKFHEATQMFVIVDYVRTMTVKKNPVTMANKDHVSMNSSWYCCIPDDGGGKAGGGSGVPFPSPSPQMCVGHEGFWVVLPGYTTVELRDVYSKLDLTYLNRQCYILSGGLGG